MTLLLLALDHLLSLCLSNSGNGGFPPSPVDAEVVVTQPAHGPQSNDPDEQGLEFKLKRNDVSVIKVGQDRGRVCKYGDDRVDHFGPPVHGEGNGQDQWIVEDEELVL